MRFAPKGRAAGYSYVVSALHKGRGLIGEEKHMNHMKPLDSHSWLVQTSQEEGCFCVICPPRGGTACNLYKGMDWTSSCPAQPLLNSCSQLTLWLKQRKCGVILGNFFHGRNVISSPNLLLSRLHAFFYKIWFRCYTVIFSPWSFPDKSLGFRMGVTCGVNLAESLSSKPLPCLQVHMPGASRPG